MFNATLIHCRDPFRPHLTREVAPIRRRVRLDTVLRRQGMISGRGRSVRRLHAFMPLINGKPVLERDWGRPVRDGDLVTIASLPMNGGGSNPLQLIMQLAVVALSIAAPYLAPAAWGVAAGTLGGAMLSAGVMLAGTFLVNALVPPTRAPTSMGASQASPTYTIGAQGNSARLQNPIPVLYGRYRIYPDFASQPYVENHGNEQYLYQLFCISQGDIEVEKLMIGDTDISSYGEVQSEIIRPGGAMTLFPDNVVTSADVSGIELLGANEKPTGAPDSWTQWVGPFVANPAGTQANYIGIDITLPSGLFRADDKGNPTNTSVQYEVQAQLIDDQGIAIGDWFDLTNSTISMATIQPQMISNRYIVPAGRYQVRAQRVGNKNTDSRTANTIQWSGMRAYLPSQHYYGNVTLLAMIIKATNNLNSQTAKQINVIATRKLPQWDGSQWLAPKAATDMHDVFAPSYHLIEADAAYYDELDFSGTWQYDYVTDEYLNVSNGTGAAVADYAMIDVTLPGTARTLQSVTLTLGVPAGTQVYVRDYLDVATMPLGKASGETPTSDDYVAKWDKPRGAWRSLGAYASTPITIPAASLKNSMRGDRMEVLLYNASGFSITGCTISYTGVGGKEANIRQATPRLSNTQLLSTPTVAASDLAAAWTVQGAPVTLVPMDNYNSPRDPANSANPIAQICTFSAADTIARTVSLPSPGLCGKRFAITAYARYFPKAFINATDPKYSGYDSAQVIDRIANPTAAPITPDTNDLRTVRLEYAFGTSFPSNGGDELEEFVGLSWRAVTYYVEVPPVPMGGTDFTFRLSCPDGAAQIAKVFIQEVQ